jgi:hypothetical protein
MSRIRFEDVHFEHLPLLALALSSPSAPTPEKIAKRQMQRHPGSTPGRGRGRPRLTEAEAAESKQRQKALHREWMRDKRALDRFARDSENRAPRT